MATNPNLLRFMKSDPKIGGIPLISLALGLFGVLLLAQSLLLYLRLRKVRKSAERDRRSWVEVPAKILFSRVETETSSNPGGSVYFSYSARFRYEYSISGTVYTGTRYSLAGNWSSSDREVHEKEAKGYPEGAQVTAWVDPQKPAESVLRLDDEAIPDTTLFQFLMILFGFGLLGVAYVIAFMSRPSKG